MYCSEWCDGYINAGEHRRCKERFKASVRRAENDPLLEYENPHVKHARTRRPTLSHIKKKKKKMQEEEEEDAEERRLAETLIQQLTDLLKDKKGFQCCTTGVSTDGYEKDRNARWGVVICIGKNEFNELNAFIQTLKKEGKIPIYTERM